MVSIGTGRADPRPWVQAAYLLADAAQDANRGDKLPTQAQITTALGISEDTVRRASRELTRLGLIRLRPGHGYYPGIRS